MVSLKTDDALLVTQRAGGSAPTLWRATLDQGRLLPAAALHVAALGSGPWRSGRQITSATRPGRV